jgi:hypothetical protein
MATLGYCLQYMLKINLGMAIVCMVNNTVIMSSSSTSISYNSSDSDLFVNTSSADSTFNIQRCAGSNYQSNNENNKLKGEFEWSKSVQGFLLASYFWGYIITQVKNFALYIRYYMINFIRNELSF